MSKKKASARNAKTKDDYEVGYKKPPKASQFKPGVSGNPKGRPKKSKNLNTLLNNELDEVVSIREHGRVIQLSKRELMVKKMVHEAVNGKPGAAKTLIGILGVDPELDPKELISADDQKILERFVNQLTESQNE